MASVRDEDHLLPPVVALLVARHFEKAELMLWPLQLRDLAASLANWSAISLPTTVCVLASSGHFDASSALRCTPDRCTGEGNQQERTPSLGDVGVSSGQQPAAESSLLGLSIPIGYLTK